MMASPRGLRWYYQPLLAFTVLVVACLRPAAAQVSSSNRDLRESAIQSIPFDKLTEDCKSRLSRVVNRPTLHRRLPTQTVECNPDLHLFLLRNPEVVVNMWQIMGATTMTLKRTGPYSFSSTDGAGTESNLELVYGTPELHVLYGEGKYEGPLLKRATTGRCVLVLKSSYDGTDQARSQVSDYLDVFLQLDDVGSEIVAKTLQPLLGKTADHNFAETTKFVGRVSSSIEKNNQGVERLANRLLHVQPEVREQFVRLAEKVHNQARAFGVSDARDADLSLQDSSSLSPTKRSAQLLAAPMR